MDLTKLTEAELDALDINGTEVGDWLGMIADRTENEPDWNWSERESEVWTHLSIAPTKRCVVREPREERPPPLLPRRGSVPEEENDSSIFISTDRNRRTVTGRVSK